MQRIWIDSGSWKRCFRSTVVQRDFVSDRPHAPQLGGRAVVVNPLTESAGFVVDPEAQRPGSMVFSKVFLSA